MNNIKRLRTAMGISQEYLGQKLNVRKTTICRYESGIIPLSDDNINSMADFFNVSADCIIGREDIPADYPATSTIGDRLRKLRLKKNLSQNDVANMLNISRSTYVCYESNKSRPVRRLPELAKLLDTTVSYILGTDEVAIGETESAPAFSSTLKYNRKQHDYSQAQLAKLLGVTQQAVGLWEQGKVMPDISTLIEIAKLFNVSIDHLLNSDTETTPQPDENEQDISTMGSRIRDLRITKGYSQKDMAELLGISRPAYVSYETDKYRPVRRLPELSAILGTSVAYLLGISDNVQDNMPLLRLSNEALDIAKKFDALDARGQDNIRLLIEREYQLATSVLDAKK